MSETFDIIVAGGGPAGVCAALAAARRGSRVALIERHPVLGGMGTAALVNNFCNAYHDGERFIIGGIFAEIRSALIARDALYVTHKLEPYNHKVFQDVLTALCREAGVQLFLQSSIKRVAFSDTGEVAVDLDEGASLRGKVAVDATGDAVLAANAGVPMLTRAEGRRLPMPLTLCYLIGPVNLERVREQLPEIIQRDDSGKEYLYLGPQRKLSDWVRTARERGELTIPRDRIAVAYSVPQMEDQVAVNFGRIAVSDPSDAGQLKQAEAEGLRQMEEGERFFRRYVPGFEDVKVTERALQIGVRESRQIEGRYVLRGDDVLECRQCEDVVAQCCYSVDIHEPDSDKTTMVKLPHGKHFDIPLRSLIPAAGPAGLIVAGRCISADTTAMSSFRVSPSVMAIGEAAGVTAALAVREGKPVAGVSAAAVQDELRKGGAILA